MISEFAPIFKLGRAERLQLVVDLWDSLAVEDSAPEIAAVKRDELRRRKEHFANNPSSGRTWEEVKQRARAAHD
jgi:putative addiction module component (TIGR02574 family)